LATLASLLVRLGVDTRTVKSDLYRGTKDAERAGKETGRRFSAGMKATLAVGALALAGGALLALKGPVMDAVGAASDLNETISKVGVVFGSAAGDITTFAKTAKTNIGQSQQAALDAAATFGVFGKSAGLTGKNLSAFSLRMVGLTSDMASFSNTTPEEAIEAVGAALRGESEPIRRYGVLLDDATLRQAAFRLGLIKSTKQALTPANKVLAAQAEILRQTKDAQGDFARTAGGAANQQRILNAQIADAKTKLGSFLLPAWQSLLTLLNKKVVPFVEKKVIPAVQRMAQTFKRDVAPVLVQFGQFIGKNVLPNLRAFAQYLHDKLGPVVADIFGRLKRDVPPLFEKIRQAIADNRPQLQALFDAVKTVFEFLVAKIGPALSFLFKWWGILFSVLITVVGGLVRAFFAIKSAVSTAVNWIKERFTASKQFVIDFLRMWAGIPGQIRSAFVNLATIITAPFRAAFNAIARLWNSTVGRITFTVPSWVPVLGGKSFSMPRLPILGDGGGGANNAAIPRGHLMHHGGIVPGSGDQMILAKGGEGVFTREQMAALGQGGGGGRMVLELRSGGSALDDLLIKLLLAAFRRDPQLRKQLAVIVSGA